MKIARLGYNPINKSNQNYNNKEQNPSFKGTIVGKILRGFDGEINHRYISELLEQLGMSLATKEHKMGKTCTVIEPEETISGEGRTITVKFGEILNKVADAWVKKEQPNLPPGVSLEFIPNQHSDLPSGDLDLAARVFFLVFG